MPDCLMTYIGWLQGGFMRGLAAELRAGGSGTAILAFSLGALHALTPGHGKAALAAYFLGREARVIQGLRLALTAALLHVLSGFTIFLVFRFVIGQSPNLLGRSPPAFALAGYGLIVLAGIVMLVQSLRTNRAHDGGHALTAGIGLLPCPLTISVLGFAWTQSSGAMVGLVLLSLSLGIAVTIGTVAVLAIIVRDTAGGVMAGKVFDLESASRIVQGLAAVAIICLGIYAVAVLPR